MKRYEFWNYLSDPHGKMLLHLIVDLIDLSLTFRWYINRAELGLHLHVLLDVEMMISYIWFWILDLSSLSAVWFSENSGKIKSGGKMWGKKSEDVQVQTFLTFFKENEEKNLLTLKVFFSISLFYLFSRYS